MTLTFDLLVGNSQQYPGASTIGVDDRGRGDGGTGLQNVERRTLIKCIPIYTFIDYFKSIY